MVLLDKNGIRCDGRKVDELRRIMIKAGVLKNANGSAYIEFGDNKIMCGVYGPRDVHPKTHGKRKYRNTQVPLPHGAVLCQ